MEALERARAAYGTGAYDDATIEFLFPEVKESEDERIRNLIYCLIRDRSDNQKLLEHNGVSVDKALAYLEKQKEQKPVEKEITLTSFEGTLNTFLFDFANSPIEDCEPKEYVKKHSAEILKAAYKELNAKLQQDIFEARQEGVRDGYEVAKAEQKPAEWSEEDKRILDEAIGMIEARGCWVRSEDAVEQVSDFLKSLPDRFNLQPKQEWSEEDEKMLNAIIEDIHCGTDFNVEVIREANIREKWLRERLKSLRPYPHWKPSEEQMCYLKEAYESYDFCGGERSALESLYNDLKKL